MEGHQLHKEDIYLMYTFGQATEEIAQFEVHSDIQALVLLDFTPEMVDEDTAQEVINCTQKLHKKHNLVPTD